MIQHTTCSNTIAQRLRKKPGFITSKYYRNQRTGNEHSNNCDKSKIYIDEKIVNETIWWFIQLVKDCKNLFDFSFFL